LQKSQVKAISSAQREANMVLMKLEEFSKAYGRYVDEIEVFDQSSAQLLKMAVDKAQERLDDGAADPVQVDTHSALIDMLIAGGMSPEEAAALMAVPEIAAMLAIAPGPNGLELMPKDRLKFLFPEDSYFVDYTDLLTGNTFSLRWDPRIDYHTDTWFRNDEARNKARSCLSSETSEAHWKKSSSWSKDARPGYVSATDRFGIERKIAVGLVFFRIDQCTRILAKKGKCVCSMAMIKKVMQEITAMKRHSMHIMESML